MNDVIFALKYYLIVSYGQGLAMLFYINSVSTPMPSPFVIKPDSVLEQSLR